MIVAEGDWKDTDYGLEGCIYNEKGDIVTLYYYKGDDPEKDSPYAVTSFEKLSSGEERLLTLNEGVPPLTQTTTGELDNRVITSTGDHIIDVANDNA